MTNRFNLEILDFDVCKKIFKYGCDAKTLGWWKKSDSNIKYEIDINISHKEGDGFICPAYTPTEVFKWLFSDKDIHISCTHNDKRMSKCLKCLQYQIEYNDEIFISFRYYKNVNYALEAAIKFILKKHKDWI